MPDIFATGFELMLLGMGIVFTFLTLLVFTLHGMSALAIRIGEPKKPQDTLARRAIATDQSNNSTHVAVISAAIRRYRSTQNNG